MSAITVSTLQQMKPRGEKFAVLTAYDATFAQLIDEAGVEVILVGDSLGMVVQGKQSTIPVTMDEMVYHSSLVAAATKRALVMTDMPFMSYSSTQEALHNAARLMKEGGAQMVKLEGGASRLEVVQALAENGIPVCAHLGLLPQSVHKLGGYKVQGREESAAEQMVSDALALQLAGADIMLLECVPRALARRITEALAIPVIGIGAGVDTDAQVLVLYDMLGITPGKRPSFSHDFLAEAGSVSGAIAAYAEQVKSGQFPTSHHGFD